eukprot:3924463-Amphidinium_carterae.1
MQLKLSSNLVVAPHLRGVLPEDNPTSDTGMHLFLIPMAPPEPAAYVENARFPIDSAKRNPVP